MRTLLLLFCFCVFGIPCFNEVYAVNHNAVNVVLLSFADNTRYDKTLMNQKILENTLLEELMSMQELAVMEHFPVEEVLDAEEKFNKPMGDVSEMANKTDFATAFEVPDNDIAGKRAGETVSSAKTRMIGKKYNADYLIHGTIDYMKQDSRQTFIPLKDSSVSITNPYLETLVTVRIIKADTGKIIWCGQEEAVSKETLYEFRNANINAKVGTEKFNNTMIEKALQKAGLKIARALQGELTSKKLIF